jgi:hypothetical protein
VLTAPSEGCDTIHITLDGISQSDWDQTVQTYTLTGISSGSHTLQIGDSTQIRKSVYLSSISYSLRPQDEDLVPVLADEDGNYIQCDMIYDPAWGNTVMSSILGCARWGLQDYLSISDNLTGIAVRIVKLGDATHQCKDMALNLSLLPPNSGSPDMSESSAWTQGGPFETVYGGIGSRWGMTSIADMMTRDAADHLMLYYMIQAVVPHDSGGIQKIDTIQMKVYYDEEGAGVHASPALKPIGYAGRILNPLAV